MPTVEEIEFVEESTGTLTLVFRDSPVAPATTGDIVTPDSIAWKVTTPAGALVMEGTVASPAASNRIVLSGAPDLALIAGVENRRIFTAIGVYDSTEGNNLPVNEEIEFTIRPLINIPVS